jgi:PAS domain S-box-containing protein
MESVLSQRRIAIAAVAAVVGAAAVWTTAAPFGLLAPLATLFLFARGSATWMLHAGMSVGLVASLLVATFHIGFEDATRDPASAWAAFFAIGLCIGAVVTAGAASASDGKVRLAAATSARPVEVAAPGLLGGGSLIHPEDRATAAHAAARAFWTGVPQVTRHRRRQADGGYRWMETRSEPGYSVSVDIDDVVTETEPPPAALGPSDETEPEPLRSARVVESLFGNGWAFDPAGRWIFLHPFAQKSLGVTLDDLNAPLNEGHTGWKRLLHPEDYDRVAAEWRRCLETGDDFNVEFRFRRATGLYAWARTAARATHDGQGRITGWYGIALDNDVYKKTVVALRSRERELSQLVDMVPSHIWRLAPDGEPIFFNKRMVDFLGFDAAGGEKPGRSRLDTLIEAVHPDEATEFREKLERCLATGEPFAMRYRLRGADGVYRWMSSGAVPMHDAEGRIVQWYGLGHDIDDQMHIEEELRTSKRQLEQMIDAVPVNILSFDASGNITYTSRRYLESVGSPLADIQNFDALAKDLAHPEDFPTMHRRASHGFATGQPFVNRFRRRDIHGVYRWIEARAQPLRDESGAIVQWYIASIDLEDEMRALEALRESERLLRQLVETLPAMIYCAEPDGKPTYRSQLLREFLGFDVDHLDGAGESRLKSTLNFVIHPDDLAMVNERYAHALATGEQYAARHRLRRFDGKWRWVETRAAPMRSSEGHIVQWNGVCLDIDGEVRTQEELRWAQERMARASQAASLAELSASIAHEVNQPLAAVVANSHACQRWLTIEPPNLERAQRTVERIIRDANAAADVVNRVRALFKRSVEARSLVPVAEIVMDACGLMAEEAQRRRVRVDVDVAADIPPVALDRVQIQQVMINLMRNGMEAMESNDGTRTLGMRARKSGDAVRIEVSDRGLGVENPEKIFEPFFTTKESGMGMGLAICRSIVESHGGKLWVESNDDGGATFVFTLPIGAASAS